MSGGEAEVEELLVRRDERRTPHTLHIVDATGATCWVILQEDARARPPSAQRDERGGNAAAIDLREVAHTERAAPSRPEARRRRRRRRPHRRRQRRPQQLRLVWRRERRCRRGTHRRRCTRLSRLGCATRILTRHAHLAPVRRCECKPPLVSTTRRGDARRAARCWRGKRSVPQRK